MARGPGLRRAGLENVSIGLELAEKGNPSTRGVRCAEKLEKRLEKCEYEWGLRVEMLSRSPKLLAASRGAQQLDARDRSAGGSHWRAKLPLGKA